MCGIAGWFSVSPKDAVFSESTLAKMVQAIHHRGPDGSGGWWREHVALGHARLAIIDLAAGVQPMSDPTGQVIISFNGEIYNYRELRHDLIQRGLIFQTHSDTEVILNLYLSVGWPGFSRLRGMYAFALWDQKNQTGFLVRDPLGIKPLFLHTTKSGELLFGSEVKAILASGFLASNLDEESLHLLMNFRYLPGEKTLFRGVRQLLPGKVLTWQSGKIQEHNMPSNHLISESDSLLATLRQSVARHLTADVEVGCYLSGGIDSATIAYFAKELLGHPVRSFTLAVGDNPHEAGQAAISARLLGLENQQATIPQNSTANDLAKLIWHLEVPKINALQVYHLADLAANAVKVALSGLGGDELFLGYRAHRIMHYYSQVSRWLPARIVRSAGTVGAYGFQKMSSIPWQERERAALMLAEVGNWSHVYGILRNVWDSSPRRGWIYGPRMLDTPLPDAFEVLESLWPKETGDPVMAMAQFEWHHKMVNDLLWQEDRVSMAYGLEVRVPFVDLGVWQYASNLDRKTLMPYGQLKGYFREKISAVLPHEIAVRPKSGFQVDAAAFFHTHLTQLAETWLHDSTFETYGLFNPSFVRSLLRQPPSQNLRWHYFMLYLMLESHLWMDLFPEEKNPSRYKNIQKIKPIS